MTGVEVKALDVNGDRQISAEEAKSWDKFVDLPPTRISNGAMKTVIKNKACRIEKLNSFKSYLNNYQ